MVIDKYFRMYFKNHLKQYGLNTAEGLSLLALYEEDGRTQEQLIMLLHYDKGVMTRTMKSLEKKEMIRRVNHEEDNRSYMFYLTDKGREKRPEIMEILRNWTKLILTDVQEEDKKILEKNLEQIAKTAANSLLD